MRPVTVADPAWFVTIPIRRRDGSIEPDYGRVYFQSAVGGGRIYSFDRAGRRFCSRLGPPAPEQGWLHHQGRAFLIAGPVEGVASC